MRLGRYDAIHVFWGVSPPTLPQLAAAALTGEARRHSDELRTIRPELPFRPRESTPDNLSSRPERSEVERSAVAFGEAHSDVTSGSATTREFRYC
jgi:hypothetical protein